MSEKITYINKVYTRPDHMDSFAMVEQISKFGFASTQQGHAFDRGGYQSCLYS